MLFFIVEIFVLFLGKTGTYGGLGLARAGYQGIETYLGRIRHVAVSIIFLYYCTEGRTCRQECHSAKCCVGHSVWRGYGCFLQLKSFFHGATSYNPGQNGNIYFSMNELQTLIKIHTDILFPCFGLGRFMMDEPLINPSLRHLEVISKVEQGIY